MSETKYREVLKDALEYSRNRGYVGYDKHDGMSSRLLQRFPIDYKWVNILVQESIKRSPINIRPLFLVEQRPSPVGMSLFASANTAAYNTFGEEKYLRDANFLTHRIAEFGDKTPEGFSLFHNHELQGLDKKTPIGTARIPATTWGVKALLERDNEAFSELAHSVTSFVEKNLEPNRDENGNLRIKYKPIDEAAHYTINANAVAARMYAELYEDRPKEKYHEFSRDVLRYVATCQEKVGGWMYTDPPSASHLSMDNYHNGYIIEAFLEYSEVFDSDEFDDVIKRGLDFYRNHLFDTNGAPHWDEDTVYPKDICAAAQGVIVFSKADEIEFAEQILDWTIENLYSPDEGRFYYQQRRFYTKRFTLMRWCQAWMAYALGVFLTRKSSE